MYLSTPVGFLIFNRPDLTEIVFERIAQVKPKKLLVVADGPRFPEEAEKCEKTRAVINKVDWECEILTNFSSENLGCGRRIASGIEWVFSEVEEAIFLEDDTVPALSFFYFCQALLERYRYDERVMHINGDNSLNQRRNDHSYYFSKYMHSWGWASWRRAWLHYDYNMKTWAEFKKAGLLELICENPYEQRYWISIFDQMYEDPQIIDTWDYQWLYSCWAQNGLVIAPNGNLISNIGFNRADGTHLRGNNPRAGLLTTDIWEISHPPFIVRHREADNYSFDCLFGGQEMREQDKLSAKINRYLSSVKRKVVSSL